MWLCILSFCYAFQGYVFVLLNDFATAANGVVTKQKLEAKDLGTLFLLLFAMLQAALVIRGFDNTGVSVLVPSRGPPLRDSLFILTHYPYWFTYPYFKSTDKLVDIVIDSADGCPSVYI